MAENRPFSGILVARRAIVVGGGTVLLAGCAQSAAPLPSSQPSFYRSLARAGERVDASMAAEMISGFRRNNGRGLVTVDPVLMRVAEIQANAMTDANEVGVRTGPVAARLAAQGYRARAAAEATSAGYMTLAEAFSGWRDSPPHRATMLNPSVTRLGIATGFRPNSRYRVFWALVLAQPAATA